MGNSQVKIVLNPVAVESLTAPDNIVDRHIFSLASAIAAVAKGLAPRVTGNLAGSINTKRVGPSLWEVIADVPYALMVNQGTPPHVIIPKSGKVLKFPSKSGTIVYTQKVNHPGTKPNPFMVKAMESVVRP